MQGLYYSYFLTIIEAPTFGVGLEGLYANNRTEYPHTINTLKRFNLFPEVGLGLLYRNYVDLAEYMNWKTKTCWQIDRGEDLSPVLSCEGLGDEANFYIASIFAWAGLTTFCLFLFGFVLSESLFGGLLAVLCYFYNHGEV